MILTPFYKGYSPMFDFESINALAAADDILAESNPVLKVAAIDGWVGDLNVGRLTDDALGRTICAASNLLFISSPCSIKNLPNFAAFHSDENFPADANIPPRLALLPFPCRWCLRLRVKCAECERLRLIVRLFLRPCPCPCPRRFVMILDIFFYILAK